jgi:heme/copper-type cytochrome/quinol oxidase subunit 2
MNRIFVNLAAILSSGIFAYSYLREWIGAVFFKEEILLQASNPEAPYYHSSLDLYLWNTLTFGLIFLGIFVTAIYAAIKKKEGLVFLCFVLSMIGIFLIMFNGAFK